MELEFSQKKTYELTDDEFIQITSLFEEVFTRKTTVAKMKLAYCSNPLGYSFHSIMKNSGIIVGFNSYEPAYYNYNEKKLLFACSVTSMISKSYRGISNFYKIVSYAYKYMKPLGVDLVYAYPNDNSYPLFTKLKLLKDIGKMKVYILPYRIGGLKHSLRILNVFTILFSHFLVGVSLLFASKQESHFNISKELETFNSTRYNKLEDYKIIRTRNSEFVYRIMIHEGVRTAFLIDVTPKSAYNFSKAIRYLLKKESDNFDLILYPGYLPFSINGMILMPMKYVPKKFNFTAHVLNEDLFNDDIWNINSWDTNLSNYDLI